MRCAWVFTICLLAGCLFAGCATPQSERQASPLPGAERASATPEQSAPKPPALVTRYELGAYRYPAAPGEPGSVVYRRTRMGAVPAPADRTASVAVGQGEPSSFAPLPPSAELAAELAMQRQITAELRATQAAMRAMEQEARRQFRVLHAQAGESARVQAALTAERARVRALEDQLRARLAAVPPPPPAPPPAAPARTEEITW